MVLQSIFKLCFAKVWKKYSIPVILDLFQFIICNTTFWMTKQMNNNWNWQNENVGNQSKDAIEWSMN